jgi:hypothetical protein
MKAIETLNERTIWTSSIESGFIEPSVGVGRVVDVKTA